MFFNVSRCPFKKCSLYCSPEHLRHLTFEPEQFNALIETGVFLLIPASNKGLTSLKSMTISKVAGYETSASTCNKVVRK